MRLVVRVDSIEYEIDNRIGEESDDETKQGIKDGILRIGDFFTVTTRNNITDTAPDEHEYGNRADNVKDSIGDISKSTIWTNKILRHAISASGFSAFLDSECHSFASKNGKCGADTSGNLN